MPTQVQKAEAFRQLHRREGAFVLPNPWDAGSARLLEALGFEALATTSSGFANSLGRLDGSVTLQEKLEHCRRLAEATGVPVSADLENGFGQRPEEVAEAVRQAAAAGVVGASVEDFSGEPQRPIYELELAVERIRAAAEAARSLEFPFTLTARAENFLHGRPDLDDTLRRLQAYQEAGADVLYAPGLASFDAVRQVCAALDRPVNVLASFLPRATVDELAAAGARRISVGGALARAALAPLVEAAREMLETGTFSWMRRALPGSELARLLADRHTDG